MLEASQNAITNASSRKAEGTLSLSFIEKKIEENESDYLERTKKLLEEIQEQEFAASWTTTFKAQFQAILVAAENTIKTIGEDITTDLKGIESDLDSEIQAILVTVSDDVEKLEEAVNDFGAKTAEAGTLIDGLKDVLAPNEA